MKNSIYKANKIKFAYSLYKSKKLFKKVRAIICLDNKLLMLKVCWKNNSPNEYIFPGGGVDEGESIRETVVREAFEEYGAVVTPEKNLGKRYYSVNMQYNNEKFISKRVEYYYLCKCEKIFNKEIGIDGEFDFDDRTFERVALNKNEIKNIDPKYINNINSKILFKILENVN